MDSSSARLNHSSFSTCTSNCVKRPSETASTLLQCNSWCYISECAAWLLGSIGCAPCVWRGWGSFWETFQLGRNCINIFAYSKRPMAKYDVRRIRMLWYALFATWNSLPYDFDIRQLFLLPPVEVDTSLFLVDYSWYKFLASYRW